jgi:serine/threonine protein kinase
MPTTVTLKMYCPKCKQSFEEGSRRFCPTDGARLTLDPGSAAKHKLGGGIFASIVSKPDATRKLDESFPDIPKFVITEPRVDEPILELDETHGDFFEFEDEPVSILDPASDPVVAMPVFTKKAEVKPEVPKSEKPKPIKQKPEEPKPEEQKPAARKINVLDIPAGHVELGKKDTRLVKTPDFRFDEPHSFVGQTVKGRYIATEYLGGEEGSFAYLADDKIVADKKVLVRILSAERSNDSTNLDEEIVSFSHVTHPNIARLIDSGQFNDGTRFLISEYVDALSVDDILSIHGFVDPARTGRVIRQIANALNEVHQEGIIHRDLRPENIIVTPGEGDVEQAILVNFGASSGEPHENNLFYKAPEVFDGRVSTVSGEVYSLAVVAYEMLTGSLPFDGETVRAVFKAQQAGLKQLPTQIRPELPPAVDTIFEKALSFTPADRYPKVRDFGDAIYAALNEAPEPVKAVEETLPITEPILEIDPEPPLREKTRGLEIISPAGEQPAWKNRSPEPPQGAPRSNAVVGTGLLVLLAILAFGIYFSTDHRNNSEVSPSNNVPQSNAAAPGVADTEMPPLARNIPQPPNTNFYQNSKQNLKGDLIRNFVGFKMYYPKDWKVNGPQASSEAGTRGKFLDISRLTPDGRPKEQMLISYYPSKGTYTADEEKFPTLVKETNETLRKILPGYQTISASQIKVNGDWDAYEVKFQGSGTSESGEKLTVWGRRLFIPAARPGVRNGFEITMLATSLSDEVKSVDDVGVRGELAAILYSFEPSQNF